VDVFEVYYIFVADFENILLKTFPSFLTDFGFGEAKQQ
jgi:hypothetical protein